MAAKFSWIFVELFAVWIRLCCSSCGDHLEGSSGDLRFPISGGNVGESLRCKWTIRVPERFRVKITFTDFVMKTRCCSCTHDFLEIRDGSLDNSTLIERFCANREPKFVYSTRNVIWIQFASDFRTYKGNRFRLSYEAVCGSHYTDSSGTFRSPGYPFPYKNKDCIYSIEVPKGRIKVKFESFSVEGRMPVCLYDFLEVKEIGYYVLSSSQGQTRRRRYCGNEKPPIIYSTRGSNLWFRFKSEGSGSGESRFVANYRTIFAGEGTCGGTLKDRSGLIYSQNYPYHFPPGQECAWKIRVATNMHAHLYFDTLNFGFKMDEVCEDGHLEIYDGFDETSHKIGEYCGDSIPSSRIISRTNELMIKAVSKLEGVNIGWFSLHYESSSGSACGMSKFTCTNRQCIESGNECNGQKECEDGSDEEDCPETKDPGYLSWYRFWPVSIVGGMLIVGVWLWRAWKKIMAARSEVGGVHAATRSPNHIELLPRTAVEPPSYSEAVAQNEGPPPTYEEALRERLNPPDNIPDADTARVHSDSNTGNIVSPGNTCQTLSMVVYEGSSTSSRGSPYDSHRKRGYNNLHKNSQRV